MNDEKSHEEHKNKIELTVRHGGDEVFLTENVHHKVQHVLDEALKEFKEKYGVVPPANTRAFLRYGNTDLSDLNKSLEEYGIPDKAVLDLSFKPGGG